jgi:preprotein translocase subunit SecA
MDIMEEVLLIKVQEFTTRGDDPSDWNMRGLVDWVNLTFPAAIAEEEFFKAARGGKEAPLQNSMFDGLSEQQFGLLNFISKAVRDAYNLKVSFERPEALIGLERYTVLGAIDQLWQEHLYSMDSLRSSIGLRQYGQRDPLIEYKAEAFKLFDELMTNIKSEVCHNIFRSASSLMAFENFLRNMPQVTLHQTSDPFAADPSDPRSIPEGASDVVSEANVAVAKSKPVRAVPRVGRNDPCPCGSGKKYKSCCGK